MSVQEAYNTWRTKQGKYNAQCRLELSKLKLDYSKGIKILPKLDLNYTGSNLFGPFSDLVIVPTENDFENMVRITIDPAKWQGLAATFTDPVAPQIELKIHVAYDSSIKLRNLQQTRDAKEKENDSNFLNIQALDEHLNDVRDEVQRQRNEADAFSGTYLLDDPKDINEMYIRIRLYKKHPLWKSLIVAFEEVFASTKWYDVCVG